MLIRLGRRFLVIRPRPIVTLREGLIISFDTKKYIYIYKIDILEGKSRYYLPCKYDQIISVELSTPMSE